MTPEQRFSGRVIPASPHMLEAERTYETTISERIISQLTDSSLLDDDTTARALMTSSYSQQDRRSCFYAGLIGISGGISPGQPLPDEQIIIAASEQERLIGPHGAETLGRRDQRRQTDFVRRHLGLNIGFPQELDGRVEGANALTHGLVEDGNPVLLGLPRHWVVLDGIVKNRDGSLSWIGMNPAGGQRIVLNADLIHQRLMRRDMPVVTVENLGRLFSAATK